MDKKHLVFIVNPKSGVEREKIVKEAIQATLDHEQYTHEVVHTAYAKHGIELAKQAAAKGAFAVVAVGGDGSVNDIVNGLYGTDTALAIIPKGSGNGTARTLGIPLDIHAALSVINRGNSIKMDIAFANERMFISNAGVAFDALIAKKFATSVRRGMLMYSWLVTKYLWLYKERTFDIVIDGKELKERAFMACVCNMQQFGYNFKIAPGADWTDGLFDVIIVRRFPKILGMMVAIRAMTGTITKSPWVRHMRAKEVTISNPILKLMQTDGDAHECASTIKFTLKPAAQLVLVP